MPLVKMLVRLSAFLGKEVAEVRRQLRLVFTLVLGPFLILFIFGIGYVSKQQSLTTIIVGPPGTQSRSAEIKKQFAVEQLDVREVTEDLGRAMSELHDRRVDAVAVIPTDPYSDILGGKQAELRLNVNEIDPVKINIVYFLTYAYSNELNKRILEAGFKQGQAGLTDLQGQVGQLRQAVNRLQVGLQANDVQAVTKESGDLLTSSNSVLVVLAVAGGAVNNDQLATLPISPAGQQKVDSINKAQTAIRRLNDNVQAIRSDALRGQASREQQVQRLKQVDEDLATLEATTGQITNIAPGVLVSPFRAIVKNEASKEDNPNGVEINFINYYTPAVLALLLQHIAVTFAALSLVRERTIGTLELFRVAPIRATEILVSKYVAYILFVAVVAAALVAALVSPLLGVPFKGDPLWFSLTALALVFASLGLGFFISLISQTESQAVQLSMLVLLTSVFFSGFFLSLSSFNQYVQYGAQGLPITHGIQGFQQVMLRGQLPTDYVIGALTTMGLIFFVINWLLFRRELAKG